MVLLDQFYQISEKDTRNVSGVWKFCHVSLFAIAVVCGFITACFFGYILDDFDYYCVLNAQIVFTNISEENSHDRTFAHHIINVSTTTTSTEIPTTTSYTNITNVSDSQKTSQVIPVLSQSIIDLTLTRWGSQANCNFCQFTAVISMIFAAVMGAFFTIISKGGGGYESDIISRPWQILYPSIFFSVVFTLILTISTHTLWSGLKSFCEQFEPELGNTLCVEGIDIYTLQFHKDKASFFIHYCIAITCAYIGACAWILQLILLMLRVFCVVDFNIHNVKILQKNQEQVLQVIDYCDYDSSEDPVTSV